MTTTTETIDLKKFCAEENGKYHRDHPYVRNGYRYACDGRIALRLPAIGEPDEQFQDDFKPPDIDKILADRAGGKIWKPWPTDVPIKCERTCLVCDGIGRVECVNCVPCEGTGFITCSECKHDNECDECGGDGCLGGKTCPNCKGKKFGMFPHHRIINGAAFNIRYCLLVETLSNVEYCADTSCMGVESLLSIGFRFDGGIGVLMPMTVTP